MQNKIDPHEMLKGKLFFSQAEGDYPTFYKKLFRLPWLYLLLASLGCLCWFPYRLVTEPRLIWLQLSGISLVLGIAFFVQLALKWPELPCTRFFVNERCIRIEREDTDNDGTEYIFYEDIQSVKPVSHGLKEKGDIVCSYFSRSAGTVREFTIHEVPDYYNLCMTIRDQRALHMKDLSEAVFDPDALPKESVTDIQTELFGADPKLTGAFPDPTVNPLPELPEDSDNQFMQQNNEIRNTK